MAIKYKFTYNDIENTLFTCEISSQDYTGEVIKVEGSCVLEYPEIEHIYTVIRGSGMSLSLEANLDVNFEDLYSDGEKQWLVRLFKEGAILFVGYIDPAGLYEDLTTDRWIVTLDCVDGLGLLDNLSYVNDEGDSYTGKSRDIEVIYNCLKRTGITEVNGESLMLISSINTRYNGLNNTECPLANVYSNQERFYKNDGKTIMSCKEVLESTLRKYGGSIVMVNGVYHVFSFYELLGGERRFYTYVGPTEVSNEIIDYSFQSIGSNISEVSPCWVNANQSKSIIPGVGAVRINYKFGFVKSLLDNSNFIHNGSVISNWNILIPSDVELLSSGVGFKIDSNDDLDSILQANDYDVSEGGALSFSLKVSYNALFTNYTTRVSLRVIIKILSDDVVYYLDNALGWVTDMSLYGTDFTRFNISGEDTWSFDLPPIPSDGILQVVLIRPETTRFVPGQESYLREVFFIEVKITGSVNQEIKGETHTQQISGKNTRVEDIIEVSVGDNPSDLYLGAIYKNDEDTNTSLWSTIYTPSDIVGFQSILEILSEYISIYRKEPSYQVKGDVYGFFSYLNIYTFDLIPDRLFMISGYVYNTSINRIECSWKELKRSSYFGNTYTYNLNKGDVEKPTIESRINS